jgi:hypothetical protein
MQIGIRFTTTDSNAFEVPLRHSQENTGTMHI